MTNGTPRVVLKAIDRHEDLIKMPLPLNMLAHVGCALCTDLAGEDWSKTVDPEPHIFMANVDATFVQQIFNIEQ